MARYIDADELELEYYDLFIHGTIAVKSVLPIFADLLAEQPTADVAEVKHGEWIEDGYYDNPCVCSYCGAEAMHNNETPKSYIRAPYCWSCGAKMD